jgi:hypothetical protein
LGEVYVLESQEKHLMAIQYKQFILGKPKFLMTYFNNFYKKFRKFIKLVLNSLKILMIC